MKVVPIVREDVKQFSFASDGNGGSKTVRQAFSPIPRRERLPRQVVTLAFVSERVAATVIREQLARSLCVEASASVVLVQVESPRNNGLSGFGPPPELYLNGEFHMPNQILRTETGFYSLTIGITNEAPSVPGIESLIKQ